MQEKKDKIDEGAMVCLPEAFVERMKELLGLEWEDFLACYARERYASLRFNPLKKGLKEEQYPQLLSQLGVSKVEAVPWAEHGYYYRKKTDEEDGNNCQPGRHMFHEMGLYYIQEPSAMSAATLLAPKPGERVLDLCAAPGGKSTQLAGYMKQQGLLVSNEINEARAKILSSNIERLGIANALVCSADSSRLASVFPSFFHRILVDAPCSGEGMFRKNDNAVDEWSLEHVQMCAQRQAEILDNAATMLMPGGMLVYSTCTFAPEENEGAMAAFLLRHPEFQLVHKEAPYFSEGQPAWGDGNENLRKTFRLWPHKLKGEGHFAAVLQKAGVLPEPVEQEETTSSPVKNGKGAKGIKGVPQKGQLDAEQKKAFLNFAEETLQKETVEWILKGRLELFGEQLYRLPQGLPTLARLRVLRAGLHLGSFKKNRFEPAHAFALFLDGSMVKQMEEYSSKEAESVKFFAGESLPCTPGKGWCLVCVDGFSAGWGKKTAAILKNHYPKGLRTNCR